MRGRNLKMLPAAAHEMNTTTETITSLLPLAAIMVPLVGALLTYWLGQRSDKLRNACTVLVTLATITVVMALYPLLQKGAVEFILLRLEQFNIFLRVDFFS